MVAGIALIAVPALTIGRTGALAGLLTVTWTGGTIVIRRHWSLAYAGMVIVASVLSAMAAGLPATNVLTATAATALPRHHPRGRRHGAGDAGARRAAGAGRRWPA